MDYSSLPNDPDHPIGSSPWQSSPQPNSRTFMASEASSAPSSPLGKHSSSRPHSPQAAEQDGGGEDHGTGISAGEESRSYGADRVAEQRLNGTARTVTNNAQPPPRMQQPSQSQEQQSQQPRQPQSEHQRTVPNRYHGGAARQPQRQNLPQYKLQAKITSLERTGRKDPVLKFDVHVCVGTSDAPYAQPKCTNVRADKPTKISDHPIPRCQTNALGIHKAGRPPDLLKPRSLRTCSTFTVDRSRRRYRRGRSPREELYATMA